MFLTYQYRIKPNKSQREALSAILEQDRQLYNAALQERKMAHEKAKKSITLYDQQKSLTIIRADGFEGHATRQRGALIRLDKAFKAFFRRIKQGKKAGYPRFKGKDRWKSIDILEQYRVKDGKFYSADFKKGIKIHFHRPLPKDMIKHCGATLAKDHKGWVVNLKIEIPDTEKVEIKKSIGIDVGLNKFFASDSGEMVEAPKHYRKAEKGLKRIQRRLARCKRGSKNRKRVVNQIQRAHAKVRNCRKDFHHKLSRKLVDNYDEIVAEDLNIAGMVRNHHLSKSITDAGWGLFLSKVAYKAENAGKHFIMVNPKNTSQICSSCGAVVKKSLSVRVHSCGDCGYQADRDVNAARNILGRGTRLESLSPAGFDQKYSLPYGANGI